MSRARRELRFASLDDAVRDVENLLSNGYDRVGNWTLSQVCDHLSDWMTYPMDGFPKVPLPVRFGLWMMRNTVAQQQLRSMLTSGKMPAASPTMTQSVHPPGDDASEVQRFRTTAERLKAFAGPAHPSPLFGLLSREDGMAITLIHSAHHLSFLVPKTG